MTAPVTSAYFDEVLTDFDFSVTSPAVCAEDTTVSHPTAINAVPVPATSSTPAPLADERSEFYACLEEVEAATLRATATRINNCRQIARESTLEIGRELVAIKDSMPGHFDQWLKLEFNMSKATAWNYINVVQEFGDAPEVVDVLPSATAYRLAAKATPENVRREIVEEIKTGAAPTKADVERRIADARSIAAEEKRARKQAERDQADAERQRRDDEQAWRARVAELAEAGKTEDEIGKERRAWDTVKLRKERQKQSSLAAKQRSEEEATRRGEEFQAKRARQCESGRQAADFLRATLKEDFETFRSLMTGADVYEFQSAVLEQPGQQSAH